MKEVFSAALERAPAERAAFLDQTCGPVDAAVRREVEALLAAHQTSDRFLEIPAADLAPTPSHREGEKTCSFCHTPLPLESRFCLSCGADLRSSVHRTPPRLAQGAFREPARGGRAPLSGDRDARARRHGGGISRRRSPTWTRVAVKVLLPELADDQAFVKRIEREARIAAGLDHPNIVPIYSVEQDGDFHYFVMKYVVG